MKELRYFLVSCMCLGATLLTYFIFLDRFLIPNSPKLGYSYKQFLLENCPGSKIVIDSGSSSHFGINSDILSEKFGFPVINISDNATYPLSSRIHRYNKYLKKGDILVLPLEWRYYYTDAKPLAFYSTIFRENLSYYRAATIQHRTYLVFTTPFYLAVEQLLLQSSPYTSDFNENQLKNFERYIEYNQSGDVIFELKYNAPNKDIFKNYTWDKYTLGNQSSIKGLSATAIKYFHELDKLVKKGIQVIVAPPSLVSDKGYAEFEDLLDKLTSEIKSLTDETNITYLNNYRDYVYPIDAGYDTYYHLNPEFRDIRTNKICSDLSSVIKKKKISQSFDKASYYRNTLYEVLSIETFDPIKLLEPPIDSHIWIRDDSVRKYVGFDPGWYPIEKGGVWARSGISNLYLNIAETNVSHIEVLGKYYDPPQNTQIYINDKMVGEYDLNKPHLIPLGKSIDVTKIGFFNTPTISPNDKSGSSDRRKLSLGLRRIKLVSVSEQ